METARLRLGLPAVEELPLLVQEHPHRSAPPEVPAAGQPALPAGVRQHHQLHGRGRVRAHEGHGYASACCSGLDHRRAHHPPAAASTSMSRTRDHSSNEDVACQATSLPGPGNLPVNARGLAPYSIFGTRPNRSLQTFCQRKPSAFLKYLGAKLVDEYRVVSV